MIAKKTSRSALMTRTLVAVLVSAFAVLAAGCAAGNNPAVPSAPAPTSNKSAPAPGVVAPAPPRNNS